MARANAIARAPLNADSDAKTTKQPAVPHLRGRDLCARAKVQMAMGELEAAQEDVQQVYLEVNRKAGWLSMRTIDLDEIEKLKATVLAVGEQPDSE